MRKGGGRALEGGGRALKGGGTEGGLSREEGVAKWGRLGGRREGVWGDSEGGWRELARCFLTVDCSANFAGM